jgi:hypothetical protein
METVTTTLAAPRARTLRRRVAVRRGRPVRTRRISARRSRSDKLRLAATCMFVAAALSAIAGALAGQRGVPHAELAVLQLFIGGALYARARHAAESS